jgi:ATP-dependent DNA helicase RecQ
LKDQIFPSVFKIDSRINKIIEVLTKVPGCAIVYCKSVAHAPRNKRAIAIAGIFLRTFIMLDWQEERNKKQEDWIADRTRVIVCTNAFGMGIDKPNVRAVVHADVPTVLKIITRKPEEAGRDGKRSYAVLLFDDKEIEELEELPALRYPAIEDIRIVYQSISNYLQYPRVALRASILALTSAIS